MIGGDHEPPLAVAPPRQIELPAELGDRELGHGQYELVKGLEIDDFSRERMKATLDELLAERDGVKHLVG